MKQFSSLLFLKHLQQVLDLRVRTDATCFVYVYTGFWQVKMQSDRKLETNIEQLIEAETHHGLEARRRLHLWRQHTDTWHKLTIHATLTAHSTLSALLTDYGGERSVSTQGKPLSPSSHHSLDLPSQGWRTGDSLQHIPYKWAPLALHYRYVLFTTAPPSRI